MIDKKRKSDRLIVYKDELPLETSYIVHTEMDLKMLSSSYHSDAGILTKYRLPDEIITDNGCEFQSIYWQSFFAKYNIIHTVKPIPRQ